MRNQLKSRLFAIAVFVALALTFWLASVTLIDEFPPKPDDRLESSSGPKSGDEFAPTNSENEPEKPSVPPIDPLSNPKSEDSTQPGADKPEDAGPPQPSGGPRTPDEAAVHVHVSDAKSGSSLCGVKVSVADEPLAPFDANLKSIAVTDVNGNVALKARHGYVLQEAGHVPRWLDLRDRALAGSELRVSMNQALSFRGVLKDLRGTPVQQMVIYGGPHLRPERKNELHKIRDLVPFCDLGRWNSTTSDSEGWFFLSLLPEGEIQLEVMTLDHALKSEARYSLNAELGPNQEFSITLVPLVVGVTVARGLVPGVSAVASYDDIADSRPVQTSQSSARQTDFECWRGQFQWMEHQIRSTMESASIPLEDRNVFIDLFTSTVLGRPVKSKAKLRSESGTTAPVEGRLVPMSRWNVREALYINANQLDVKDRVACRFLVTSKSRRPLNWVPPFDLLRMGESAMPFHYETKVGEPPSDSAKLWLKTGSYKLVPSSKTPSWRNPWCLSSFEFEVGAKGLEVVLRAKEIPLVELSVKDLFGRDVRFFHQAGPDGKLWIAPDWSSIAVVEEAPTYRLIIDDVLAPIFFFLQKRHFHEGARTQSRIEVDTHKN